MLAALLLFLLILTCLGTGVVAIVAPEATKYAAAGLVLIAILLILVNPEVVHPVKRQDKKK